MKLLLNACLVKDSLRLAVEMCWFESADFQMSPSDIEIKVKILLANLKF